MTLTDTRPKAYSYLRFSTTAQGDGDSTRRQLSAAREYAARHGLDLDETLTDKGISAHRGRNMKTGALGEFRRLVEEEKIESGSYLLIENLDRFSRQEPLVAASNLQALCALGITVVTLHDQREYTKALLQTDISAILLAIVGFIRAYEESATKGRRVHEAWSNKRAEARAAKKPMTATCPHWLRLNRKSNVYEIIEERAEIVKRVYREALAGVGISRIAIRLNQENVPTWGKATHWRPTYVRRLLCNPAVTGTLIPHESDHTDDGRYKRKPLDPVKGYYPRVISNATYQRVQSLRLDASAPLRGKHAAGEVQNIFAGLVRCAVCGSSMPVTNKGVKNKVYRYYVCAQARDGAGCSYVSIPVRMVEEHFFRDARRLVGTAPAGSADGGALDKEIAATESLLLALSDTIERLVDAAERTHSAAVAKRLRAAETERESAEAKLRDLSSRYAAVSGRLVLQKLADLETLATAEAPDVPALNAALRQCLSRMELDAENGTATLHWKHGGESDFQFSFPGVLSSRRAAQRNAAKRDGATAA